MSLRGLDPLWEVGKVVSGMCLIGGKVFIFLGLHQLRRLVIFPTLPWRVSDDYPSICFFWEAFSYLEAEVSIYGFLWCLRLGCLGLEFFVEANYLCLGRVAIGGFACHYLGIVSRDWENNWVWKPTLIRVFFVDSTYDNIFALSRVNEGKLERVMLGLSRIWKSWAPFTVGCCLGSWFKIGCQLGRIF